MKPEDRALDIAVVGLGQGGGNLAAQFAQLGYRSIALNTALTDLSALDDEGDGKSVTPDHRVYIGIDGYDGAGGDLNYGRECVRENAEKIRKAVADHAAAADLVLITAGLGGGTGSAASELVRTLDSLELPVAVLATLPTESESGMAKVNAMRGAAALVQIEGPSWIFVDNSRLARRHSDVSVDRYFETINAEIVQPLDSLNRVNHGLDVRPIRTLDGEDLRRLLLSGGAINYAGDELVTLDVASVVNKVREGLESSSLMPSGFALEQISTLGVVIQAPEEVLACTPFSFFERLNEKLKDATGGAGVYLGVYRSRARGSLARLQFICSSRQLPDGILAMVNDARREGSTLRDKLQQALAPLEVGEIEDFDLFRTGVRTSPARKGRQRRPVLPDLSEEGLGLSSAPPPRRHRPAAITPDSSVRASSMPPETAGAETGSRPAASPEPVAKSQRPSALPEVRSKPDATG